jgi:hypothetical protein
MDQWHRERWPVLEEVTEAALLADVEGCQLRAQEAIGPQCPVAEELKRFPVWAACSEWAYASECAARGGLLHGLACQVAKHCCEGCCTD